jgi:hypothetical protein
MACGHRKIIKSPAGRLPSARAEQMIGARSSASATLLTRPRSAKQNGTFGTPVRAIQRLMFAALGFRFRFAIGYPASADPADVDGQQTGCRAADRARQRW